VRFTWTSLDKDFKHGRLCLNVRKHFFTVEVSEHRNRLPTELVESPSLEILKSHLDIVLGNELQTTCLNRRFDKMISRGHFQP